MKVAAAELLGLRLPKAGKGPTALSKRWAIAKSAAISMLGVADTFPLEGAAAPKALLWGSRALATSLGRLSAGLLRRKEAEDQAKAAVISLLALAERCSWIKLSRRKRL